MGDDDLERILSNEEQVIPSAGFGIAVMDAIRRDSTVPPPIPFPWKRILPAVLVAMFIVVALSIAGITLFIDYQLNQLIRWPKPRNAVGAAWIALSLIVTSVAVRLSMRFACRKPY
jgi:hypothetical protein